jgi:hypothetical protein
MKVPEKLKELITQLKTHGDVAEIQRRTDLSRFRIQQALAGEDSDPEVITAVAEFYEERKDIISDYI